ncbi:MAG: hypothetical protein WA919_29270 [Coleofasciculaceae cyanobacterium]
MRHFHGLLLVLTLALIFIGAHATTPPVSQAIQSPAGAGARAPHLATTDSGDIVMSWLAPTATGFALHFATLQDGQWSTAKLVARGDNWFINWADFPSVVPIDGDFWAAHWLAKRAGGKYAYDIMISLSLDAGNSWQTPFMLHDDNTATEHGFVTLFAADGNAAAIWLDGRQMSGQGHGAGEHGSSAGAMSLRTAQITRDGRIMHASALDVRVCDCCATDVAIGADGPIAFYRNRSEREVRDIFAATQRDGQWLAGQLVARDNWVIDGCPVNGPAAAAKAIAVVVAWFSAASDMPHVRLARSTDAGKSFQTPVTIDDVRPVGHVDVVLLDTGDALISWLRGGEQDGQLAVRLVNPDGAIGPIVNIANVSASRATGFPQLINAKEAVLVAWTDRSSSQSTVRTALIDVAALQAISAPVPR